MATTVRITERAHSPFATSKVDRDAGVIRDVLICGLVSENNRDYPWATPRMRESAKLYEGAFSNADHGRDSTIDRRIGQFKSVRFDDRSRPRADFHMLKSHPMYERVMEAAERFPGMYGFSHVAECETRRDRGREVVESISRVISVDLVAEPATTTGFFEDKGNTMKTTLRAVIESLRPKLKKPATLRESKRLLLLSEDDAGMSAMMDAPVDEPAADADPDDAVGAAFVQAMHSLIDSYDGGSIDGGALVTKLKDLLKTHGKMTGAGGAEAPDEPSEEARKRTDNTAVLEGFKVCGAAGIVVTEARARMVGLTTDPAERKQLLEDLRRLTGSASGGRGNETPSAWNRHQAKPTTEAKEGDGPPAEVMESKDKFKGWLTEAN